jgi:hypothetical protein
MKLRKDIIAAIICIALGGLTVRLDAVSQDRAAQGRPAANARFTDGDRQATTDWYAQHQTRPPAGLRQQDRLSADQESRLQPGRPLDRDLQSRTHSIPADLSRRLSPPPPNHRYVAIGGHVGLEDKSTHTLRDVIHVHEQDRGR